MSVNSLVKNPALWRNWLNGAAQAIPIALGYIPVGFAYGVLARRAGLSDANTMWMSILVYAGSSQLVAVGLFAAGASPISIVLTTLIVNLRHMLMSAALSPYLKPWRKIQLAVFGAELTDETFALHTVRFTSGETGRAATLGINIFSHFSWVLGTWLGVIAGQLIGDVRPYGLDFALPGMFIALLMMQIRDRIRLGVAIFSGALSILLTQIGLTQWSVILAAVAGATIGMLVEQWTKKSS